MMHELKKGLKTTLFKRLFHCYDACVLCTFDNMFAFKWLIFPLCGDIRIVVFHAEFQKSSGLWDFCQKCCCLSASILVALVCWCERWVDACWMWWKWVREWPNSGSVVTFTTQRHRCNLSSRRSYQAFISWSRTRTRTYYLACLSKGCSRKTNYAVTTQDWLTNLSKNLKRFVSKVQVALLPIQGPSLAVKACNFFIIDLDFGSTSGLHVCRCTIG